MNGLLLYPTQKLNKYDIGFCKEDCSGYTLEITNIIKQQTETYFFETTLDLLNKLYGENLKEATKSLLDY